MFFKHCLIVLSLCLSILGAKLELDDYEEVFQQLRATNVMVPTEATVFTTTPVPILDDPVDFDEYSTSDMVSDDSILDDPVDFAEYSTSEMVSDDSTVQKGKIFFI